MNIVKKTAIALSLAFAASVFAQEDTTETTEQTAAVEETPTEPSPAAEQPKKDEKKAPVAVGSKEERPLGIRAGFHWAGVNGGTYTYKIGALTQDVDVQGATGIGFHLGASYDLMRIFEIELGGDAFQFRMLLEPGAFITSRPSYIKGTQYWLEVPITGAFTLSLFGGMRVKYAVGPYLAVGTIGEFSNEVTVAGVTTKTEQSRFDFGQWHTFGFEQNHFPNWWFDVTIAGGLMDAVKVNDNKVNGSNIWAFKLAIGYNL